MQISDRELSGHEQGLQFNPNTNKRKFAVAQPNIWEAGAERSGVEFKVIPGYIAT